MHLTPRCFSYSSATRTFRSYILLLINCSGVLILSSPVIVHIFAVPRQAALQSRLRLHTCLLLRRAVPLCSCRQSLTLPFRANGSSINRAQEVRRRLPSNASRSQRGWKQKCPSVQRQSLMYSTIAGQACHIPIGLLSPAEVGKRREIKPF